MFKEFTDTHDKYCDVKAAELDIDTCDKYYEKEQYKYTKVLEQVKDFNQQNATAGKNESFSSKSLDSDVSVSELLTVMNMPKVELDVFRGNPSEFHQFMSSFDANVHSVCCDDNLRLTRLMQYTAGPAKEAIKGCVLICGEEGYVQARSILNDRFGNPHLVSEHIIHALRQGKLVQSARYIQQLSDDLKNSQVILKKTEYVTWSCVTVSNVRCDRTFTAVFSEQVAQTSFGH